MNTRILLVFKDLEVMYTIKKILEEHLGKDGIHPVIDFAKTVADARAPFTDKKARDLIIVHVHVPEDKNDTQAEQGNNGIDFLRSLAAGGAVIPSVLISESPDPKWLYAAQDIERCNLIVWGSQDWEDNLIKSVKKALSGKKSIPEEESGFLQIDISLDKECHYYLKGIGTPYDISGTLKLDSKALAELAEESNLISEINEEECEKWEKKLHEIGETLMKKLFDDNPRFNDQFMTLMERVKNPERMRIRLVVEREAHPIVLEALVRPTGSYWMFDSPIYRTVSGIAGEDYTLFHNKEALINCLIIEANASGSPGDDLKDSDGKPLPKLRKLKNVPKECDWFETYLQKNRDKFQVGNIVRLRDKDVERGKSFSKQVQNILDKDTWHLVHFAGHSIFHQNKGYLFFPGKKMERILLETFGVWLRQKHTKFIYLSSCQSCTEDFVYELARAKIPAIVGFRWDIDDDMALDHAEHFYTNLFLERSVDRAFFKTRKTMYENHRNKKVWAAPMLILQVAD